jgi:hypothetical protein
MVIYEEIFRAFQKQKVKYLIVGGLAVNLLGSFRNTFDLDILIELHDDNLSKIAKIFKKFGYRPKVPVSLFDIADHKKVNSWIKDKHMKALNFYNEKELKEIDIIVDSPVAYQTAKKNARIIKVADIKLSVIGINELIKMKSRTGRTIDKLDIIELKKIRNHNQLEGKE